MTLNPKEITALIKEQIKNYESRVTLDETGIVTSIGDGIAEIYGLQNCLNGELVEFENGVYAMAQNLEADSVGVGMLKTEGAKIRAVDTRRVTGNNPACALRPPALKMLGGLQCQNLHILP